MKILGEHQDKARSRYRYYSRRVFVAPTVKKYHEERIKAAAELYENEPLQGSLADFFYACWYDVSDMEEVWLSPLLDRLPSTAKLDFMACVNRQDYIWKISPLATRWSVLVAPSLNVAEHKLRISRDDAFFVYENISLALIDAKNKQELETMEGLEREFFAHCLACQDRVAFMKLWFRLAKEDWYFHDDWHKCREQLDVLAGAIKPSPILTDEPKTST